MRLTVLATSALLAVAAVLPAQPPAPVQALRAEVLAVFPHDPSAFTQGLLWHQGKFYESTGLVGKSSLRRVDPATGTVEKRVEVPAPFFAEGLALVDDRLIQLTWQEKKAFVYRRDTFEKIGEFSYEGEGWGLTFDGTQLIMSDGTPVLRFRNPKTFAVERETTVTLRGRPVPQLNELEYVEGFVYANVWRTDTIVQVDPATGNVTGVVQLAGLLKGDDRKGADVLNGIAWNPERRTFSITGKNWPKLFEVQFVPQ